MARKRLSPEEIDGAYRLYQEGLKYKKIAEHLGIKYDRAYQLVQAGKYANQPQDENVCHIKRRGGRKKGSYNGLHLTPKQTKLVKNALFETYGTINNFVDHVRKVYGDKIENLVGTPIDKRDVSRTLTIETITPERGYRLQHPISPSLAIAYYIMLGEREELSFLKEYSDSKGASLASFKSVGALPPSLLHLRALSNRNNYSSYKDMLDRYYENIKEERRESILRDLEAIISKCESWDISDLGTAQAPADSDRAT